MNRIISLIKNETVLCAAIALAIISSFFVPPDAEYIKYIDFRTLSVLFCLMTIMAGLKEQGVFDCLARNMLSRVKTPRMLTLILVMLCFFFSMLITNDAALITFVPFTFTVLEMSGEKDKSLIPVTAIQTTAANLGSMLTPIGNPQNLYLYGLSGMSIAGFIKLTLPYTALSFVMFTAWCLCRRGNSSTAISLSGVSTKKSCCNKRLAAVYPALFVLCLLTVAKIVPYIITLAVVFAVTALADRHTLKKVDYSLLLTFTGFFIFIGNMGRIDAFRTFLSGVIQNREVFVAAAASQIISNVPAALLLSGFCENISGLIIGTNIGGLGTLIASMASLISFKYIARENKKLRGKYIAYFTAVNVIFLAALIGLYLLMR